MVPLDVVLWEVDTQADFMLPGGNLYVPGAEKLLPKIQKLTDAARKSHAFLVSHGCFHSPDDPEFQTFPPHCVKGTKGQRVCWRGADRRCGARAQQNRRTPG